MGRDGMPLGPSPRDDDAARCTPPDAAAEPRGRKGPTRRARAATHFFLRLLSIVMAPTLAGFSGGGTDRSMLMQLREGAADARAPYGGVNDDGDGSAERSCSVPLGHRAMHTIRRDQGREAADGERRDAMQCRPGSASAATELFTVGARIGEAANPGPSVRSEEGPPLLPDLARRVAAQGRSSTIAYAKPGSHGFDHVTAPGVATMPANRGGPDEFRLVVETANTTGWAGLKRRLQETKAHALMAQETWVPQSSLAAASQWARRQGWRSVWAPAKATRKGGISGGVAVFTREFIGLHYPSDGSHIIRPARAVQAIMEAPGNRPIKLISCYLKHGRSASGENAAILAEVGAAMRSEDGRDDQVCIAGGDFNMTPDQLLGTEFDREVAATIFCPETDRGTFRTAKTKSTIDFFLVTDRMAAAVDGVDTVEGTSNRCHVPVQATFKPRMAALKALHIRQPPRLGLERVYGPILPPPPSAEAATLADAALAIARGDGADLDDALEAAYGAWADLAEAEVENFTGELVKLRGERSKRPKLVWRSVLPERKYTPGFPRAAAAVWLRSVAAELQRITISATAAAEGHQGDWGETCIDDLTRDDFDGSYDQRANGGGMTPPEDDDSEEDDGGDDDAQRRTSSRTAADSWGQTCRILQDVIRSVHDDFPDGEPEDDVRGARDATLSLARGLCDAAMPEGHEYSTDDEGRLAPHDDVCWDHQAATAVAALAPLATALRQDLDALTTKALAQQQATDARKWKEWLTHDLAAGASRAHAFSRLPQEVIPEAVELVRGTMSGTPEDLLAAQRNKYRELWKPAQGPFHYKWRDKDELPQLTPEQLRTASSSFRARTAQTYDGFHPRQLACLSDDALRILSTILQAVEVSGRWPRQLGCVVTALLPKPKGGYRPIGLLPAAYRVWAKARRVHSDRWEAQHARQYLSSAKGNGPQDTMWRMAARHEAGTAEGEQAGIIADDLAAFFETIDRQVLMREAAALGYPAPLLRAALAAYSSARMVTLHGRVAREIYPTVGVIAGCSLAMSLVKLFYLRAMDSLVDRLPSSVVLDTHVDDLTLSAIGQPGAVAADLAAAREDLIATMSALGCHIAPDKTAVTATTRRLANEIARRAGITKGASMVPCLLGVDSTAGARRARLKAGSKKAGRLRAALARRARLSTIRKAVGRRAGKIFRTGLLPAATYGAAVWGLADAEVTRLRRLAATTMSPRAPGRSLAMVTLWHNIPTADAEHAPALAYANMVWRAMTRRNEAAMRQSSLADLRRTWTAAQAHFEPLVRIMQEERQDDGTIPAAAARRVWAQVNGPLAAAAVTLARLRWTFPSPFVFRDAEGEDHVLTATSPALIRDLLRNALRDSLELKIGYKCAADDEGFEGRRACLDLAIAASRPSRKVTPQQSAAFRAVACGAVWTASRAQGLGYATDGMCALCRKARDTIHHRVYVCEETRGAVRGAVPGWFWSEAMRTGAHGPFWTTGIFPHPADRAPRPRSDLYCEVERHQEGGDDGAAEGGCADLEGKVYVDGTCRPSAIRGLARAAVSLIKATKDGKPIKTLQIPVPRSLPQTSQAAEFLAMSVGFTCAVGPTELVGDCLGVVNKFTATVSKALSPACKYAGLVLAAFRRPEIRKTAVVRWTKAHRTLRGDEPEEVAADVCGNSAADAAAKDANSLHQPHGIDVDTEVAYRERRIPHIVAAVTAAMELFPPAPRGLQRQPKPRTAEEAREAKRHLWRYSAGAWRCTECDDFITSRSIPRYRQYQRCCGRGMADAAPSFAGQGHALVKVEADLPIVLCTRCGAWGNRRTRKLGKPCGPPTPAGLQAVTRVRGGHHPLLQHDRGGNVLPRASARIVAVFDQASGCWTDCRPPMWEAMGRTDAHDQEQPLVEAATAALEDHPMAEAASPPEIGYASEEDVFGHGGGMDCNDDHGDVTASVTQPQPTAATGAGETDARASRRRTTARTVPRDFTAEAVQRLGSTLTRRDADAAGRMQRLRRRIADKATAAHGAPHMDVDDSIPDDARARTSTSDQRRLSTTLGSDRQRYEGAHGYTMHGVRQGDPLRGDDGQAHRDERLHRGDPRDPRFPGPPPVAAQSAEAPRHADGGTRCGPWDRGSRGGSPSFSTSPPRQVEANKRSYDHCKGNGGAMGNGDAQASSSPRRRRRRRRDAPGVGDASSGDPGDDGTGIDREDIREGDGDSFISAMGAAAPPICGAPFGTRGELIDYLRRRAGPLPAEHADGGASSSTDGRHAADGHLLRQPRTPAVGAATAPTTAAGAPAGLATLQCSAPRRSSAWDQFLGDDLSAAACGESRAVLLSVPAVAGSAATVAADTGSPPAASVGGPLYSTAACAMRAAREPPIGPTGSAAACGKRGRTPTGADDAAVNPVRRRLRGKQGPRRHADHAPPGSPHAPTTCSEANPPSGVG